MASLQEISRQSSVSTEGPSGGLCTRHESSELSLDLNLMEPVVFLPGHASKPAVIRGYCVLKVKRELKIKRLTVNFTGTSRVHWPHGTFDRETVTDCTLTLFGPKVSGSGRRCHVDQYLSDSEKPTSGLKETRTPRRKCALWNAIVGSRNVSTDNDHKLFSPGTYVYDFEMVLHSHLPESIDIQRSHVDYRVRACIERPGVMNRKFTQSREITAVRCPTEDFLEDVEPMYIARTWRKLIRYEILVSGRGAPLGHRLPVSISFIELTNTKYQGLKVFLTENVRYRARDGVSAYLGPYKRTLLYDAVDGPLSTMFEHRVNYHEHTVDLVKSKSVARRDSVGSCSEVEQPEVPSTELEIDLQLPICQTHSEHDGPGNMHFDTKYKNVQINHSLEFVFVLSRPNKSSCHEQQFQITAKAPLVLRSCYAHQDNASLPAYFPGHLPAYFHDSLNVKI